MQRDSSCLTASSADADDLCAGRWAAQRGLPDLESEAASAGDRIHEYLHACRNPGKIPLPKLSDQEKELAETCWETERKEKEEWFDRIPSDSSHALETFSEKRITFEDTLYKYSGQPDVVYRFGRHIAVFDSKSGRLPVPPSNRNKQLRCLAVLAALDAPQGPVEVTVQIIQPFARREPQCVYDRKDLDAAWEEMKARVDRCMSPTAPRTPNELSCRYCKARGRADRCPESAEAVITLSQTAQELIARPTAEFLDACKLVIGIAKQAQQNAKALLSVDPDAIPGYVLEPNEPMRPIIDAQEAWNRASAMGVSLEDFMRECVDVRKGNVEKLLKAKHRELTNRDRIPQGEWSKIISEFHAGILGETPKEPSLKRLLD